MRYFILILAVAAFGAGCQKTPESPNTVANPAQQQPSIQSIGNFSSTTRSTTPGEIDWKPGHLSFNYPSEWGVAEIVVSPGMEIKESGQTAPSGSTYKIKIGESLLVCGSSSDFSAPRGSYYCDSDVGYEYKEDKYYFEGGIVEPYKVITNAKGDKIVVLDKDSRDCSGALCEELRENQYLALVNLKSETYKSAVFVYEGKYEDLEKILKTVKI